MNFKTQEIQDIQGKIKNGQIESSHDQHLQEIRRIRCCYSLFPIIAQLG